MTEVDLITNRLLNEGESARVAFLVSPDDESAIASCVCAFLNTKGGVVLVGVGADGHPNGLATEATLKRLRQVLHDSISPQVLFTVSLDNTTNGKVIVIDIPEGHDRPYLVAGTVYLRKGKRIVHADSAELRRMLEQSASDPWERRISTGFELSELETPLLEETIRRAQDRRGYQFEDPKNYNAVLSDLSLIRFGQLTNAADVLFGRKVARRHPQTRVRCVAYKSDRAGDEFLDEQLLEGPAFRLLEDSMSFLKRHIPISAEFKDGQLARDSKPRYPFSSLREGLVNALVHRDYSAFSGSVVVSIYPDRVELWNSGRLPKGISPRDLLAASHDSVLVNPDISHVFYLHELMERVGRGTYKIVQECLALGMPLPEWANASSGVRLTIYAAGAGKQKKDSLNERQTELLRLLSTGQIITMRDFMSRFGVSQRTARRDLAEIEAFGFLERTGAGPNTAYQRTPEDL